MGIKEFSFSIFPIPFENHLNRAKPSQAEPYTRQVNSFLSVLQMYKDCFGSDLHLNDLDNNKNEEYKRRSGTNIVSSHRRRTRCAPSKRCERARPNDKNNERSQLKNENNVYV